MTKYYYAKNEQEYDALMEKLKKDDYSWMDNSKPDTAPAPRVEAAREGVVIRTVGKRIRGFCDRHYYENEEGVTDFIEYPFGELPVKKEEILTKAEVIENLKNFRPAPVGYITWLSNFEAMSFAISQVEKIKVLEKTVIPQMVADYIKEWKKKGKTLFHAVHESEFEDEELYEWIWDNQELFSTAWIADDYEVIKGPMYKIPLGLRTTDGEKQYLSYKKGWYFASRHNDCLKQIFTESELKNVPEKYRDLAEKVEDHENKS